MISASGILYVISTPIGNLEDITFRAVRLLKECRLIAAEDTRTGRILFSRYDIHTPLISYHDHNKEKVSPSIIGRLRRGEAVGLISEAGTPGISDPGFYLVREALKEGIKVVAIPGPSAFLAALTASGLPSDSFVFYGFPPRKGKKRKDWLEEISKLERTVIFYESPYRLLNTLVDLEECVGQRIAVIGRELTKKFEEIKRGTLPQLLEHFRKIPPRGELVVLISKK